MLKAVINNLPSKRLDEIEKNMVRVEELMRKYEQLAGEGLPEDLHITVMVDLCSKDLRERLEHDTKDMSYKEVWDEIMAYVERKRDLFGSQVKAMDVDKFEHDEWEKYAAENDITWWGGDTVQRSWGDNHDVPGNVNPLHYKGTISAKNNYSFDALQAYCFGILNCNDCNFPRRRVFGIYLKL